MTGPRIGSVAYTDRFKRDYRRAPKNIQEAVEDCLRRLCSDEARKSLRFHALSGYRLTIYKIDVLRHSWQITMRIEARVATLRRLAPHKQIDRQP